MVIGPADLDETATEDGCRVLLLELLVGLDVLPQVVADVQHGHLLRRGWLEIATEPDRHVVLQHEAEVVRDGAAVKIRDVLVDDISRVASAVVVHQSHTNLIVEVLHGGE